MTISTLERGYVVVVSRDGVINVGIAVDRDEALRGLVIALHRVGAVVVDPSVTLETIGDISVSVERCEVSLVDGQLVVSLETSSRWQIRDPFTETTNA